ncbi:vWA domain-containing protein [Aestuariivirga sp.]|uniref:vWA domain-containing protein n=1 Tax=Aestuariivirga sp. TaxID=2650926 RepID=UPI0039E42F15
MNLRTATFHLIRRFAESQRGTTAVTFAIAIVPVLLAVGVAIDYVRYSTAQTQLQAALDGGALSAASASTLTDANRVEAAEATFNANIAAAGLAGNGVESKFDISDSKVAATASLVLPTVLMQIAGYQSMSVSVSSEIEIPPKKKAEVALVLDYSGSMKDVLGGQVKYIAMKTAARKLVDDLAAAAPNDFKVGLVPFSHHVWVSLPKSMVLGQSGGGTWTGCTQDRKYPYNLTDDTPTSNNATKWGQPNSTMHASSTCAAYVPNDLIVRPLTDDFAAVDAQLDDMVPYAYTHIALGAEFGFHLLSGQAPFPEGAPYSDTTTKKYLVLLTDGEQTEPAFGPGTTRTVNQGEANLTSICANAKAKGITVITIAYNIDDTDTVKRLSDCTTDADTDFFSIDASNNVASAFEEIKKQITAQVQIGK